MITLPLEIWLMILEPMDRCDILNIAMASRALSDPARRILAQSVTLDGEKGGGFQEYIDHLRKHDLLRLIKKLEVKMMPLDAIPWSQMSSLLSLSLGPICADQSQGPKNWTTWLYAYVTHLASFKLEEITVQAEYPMPEAKLAIPNIKRIIWNDGGGLSLPFFSLCKASLQAITELTVVVTDDPSETDTYTNLWKLRFPNLRLLNIGPGNAMFRIQTYTAVEEDFTQFLHAHPAINNLTLGTVYDPEFVDDGDIYLPLHPSTVTRTAATILPNLTLLQAHPYQIQTFVDADARFLGTLQTLALFEEPSDGIEDLMTDLLDSFEQYNQRNSSPSGIRHLSLFLFDVDYECALSVSDFKDILLRASEIYPALEVWEGTAPDVSVLKECFPKFRHLKKLHCRLENKTASVDDIRKLAEQCLSLETYRCITSGREFRITREGAEGQVQIRDSPEGEGGNGDNELEEGKSGDEGEEEGEDFSDGEY